MDLQGRELGELDRIEKESMDFFYRTRERYQALAQGDDSIITIDASQTIEKVQADIRQTLTTWLAQQENKAL